MTEIVIIAAVADNGVIGANQDIPWRISEDFRRFKRLTLGYPCIMGEATYRSLPDGSRPLQGRENIVLTLDPGYDPPGATRFGDFTAAVTYVKAQGVAKAFITGGATIYRLGLEVADTLELTRVHKDYAGDVFFPDFDQSLWARIAQEHHQSLDTISGTLVPFTYETYRRRRPPGP